ncbi:MAG TPA: asparagine synthase (glutamine-hydrolyzing) [Chromatiales bacterium]|nr:asparagine synthase (glutamine-hydrolyzing) [Chromatiales bacterium]
MCGIYGILTRGDSQLLNTDVLRRMGDVIAYRGPDDAGAYIGNGVMLGMRRLSIIDLAGGHQPISNEDGTLWVVCNGEIYNFQDLRNSLTQRGHVFKTASDTEVILHLYEEYGDDFVNHLDGMYGFALWDGKRERLLIGRDRLGIKPLYYLRDRKHLIFATEAKSILSVPGVSADIDEVAVRQYLSLGYVPAPYSIFRGIQKLPPACMLICDRNGEQIHQYWQLPQEIDRACSEAQWVEQVREGLRSAVTSQMVSDVPLGAFLSGGVDSSSIVAFMSKHNDAPINTYAIGFDSDKAGSFYNELPFARRVAEYYGTEHKEIVVRPDVAELLPRLLWHLDEPVADTAFITTFLVSEFAKKDVTVILSGVGGDELFGGYRRYLGEYWGRYYNYLPSWVRSSILAPIAKVLPSDRHSPLLNLFRYARSFMLASNLPPNERYKTFIEVFDEKSLNNLLAKDAANQFDALDSAFSKAGSSDSLNNLLHVDILTQLPDDLLMLTDKATMASSIECRVPFLDHNLVELSASMPSDFKIKGRQLKYILKQAMKDVVPEDILHRQKRGFGAPMGAWLKDELMPLVNYILSSETIEQRGLLQSKVVQQTISLHNESREDRTDHLLALINLELWMRMYIDGQSPADLTDEIKREALH